jgi:hypothetical protein
MLQAKHGRQLNLAVTVIQKFLADKGIEMSRSEVAPLVGRLTGHASYEAAQALLQGTAKGVASDVSTWRDLGHAICSLDEQQLDLPVQVSEGCDENGNAMFAPAEMLLLASDRIINAGADVYFKPHQPILLIQEFDRGNTDGTSDDE